MGFSFERVLVEFSNKGTLLEQYFRRFDCCLSCVSFFMFHTTWWEFSHCSVNHIGSWESDAIRILSHLLSFLTLHFLWRKWDTKHIQKKKKEGWGFLHLCCCTQIWLARSIIQLFYDVSCCYDPHAIHVVHFD